MKVLIEAPFDLKVEQEQKIKDKIQKLAKYDDKITQVDVFFKLDDGTTVDAVLAEIQLHVPGPEIFGSDTDQQYYDAFTKAYDKVKRQLIKAKEIRQNHHS